MNFVGVIILLLVAMGMFSAAFLTVRGFAMAALCISLAVVVEWLRRRSTQKMRLSVTPRELTWVHPDRGEGGIRWAEVGAFVLRETAKGGDITICLVPRAGEAEDGFMLSANDFGLGVEEGEARLSGFVSEITPFLPADIVVDRAMRKKMEEWELRT